MSRGTLPRASCPQCGRRVPVVVPTRNGTGETYRSHTAVAGGATPCPGSRTSVSVVVHLPHRDLSFWTGPRTWEDAALTW